MAKRRERRAETGRRSDVVIKSSSDAIVRRDVKLTNSAYSVLVLAVVVPLISFVVYRRVYLESTNTSSDLPYVYRQGLVTADMSYQQVLAENTKTSENTTRKNFRNPVLAYITPWNSQGYEMAKKFSNKFTHLSPVWYDLKSQGRKLVLEGRHNADQGWIAEIRRAGTTQILPRIVLEAIPVDLLKKEKQRDKAVNLIIAECKEVGYDGIVLESWSRWAAYGILHDPDMRNAALQFIKQLGQAMHSIALDLNGSKNLQLVYVIGPPHSNKMEGYDFGPQDLRILSNDVDAFSLMTYDFSGPQNPGPNAPLKWIHSTLELLLNPNSNDRRRLAQKIFVGINFYGNDFVVTGGFGGGPILGRDYLTLLEKYRPGLKWEKNSEEHYFAYDDERDVRHVVFYPTLMSISVRLKEAVSWGAGISIWEIGQGLECFFDVL